MKKCTLTILLLAVTSILFAQQLFLESGHSTTSFYYTNSQGISMENLQSSSKPYFAIGFKRSDFVFKKINWTLSIRYAGFGAIGSVDSQDILLKWDFNYLGFGIGLEHKILTLNKFIFYVKSDIAANILLDGYQIINNSVIDLNDISGFNKTILEGRFGAGFSCPISEKVFVFAQYMRGITNDLNIGKEKLSVKSHCLTIGLLIDLNNKESKNK